MERAVHRESWTVNGAAIIQAGQHGTPRSYRANECASISASCASSWLAEHQSNNKHRQAINYELILWADNREIQHGVVTA